MSLATSDPRPTDDEFRSPQLPNGKQVPIASVGVTNSAGNPRKLLIEPWGDRFFLAPETDYVIVAYAEVDEPDDPDSIPNPHLALEFSDGHVVVWNQCRDAHLRIYRNGNLVWSDEWTADDVVLAEYRELIQHLEPGRGGEVSLSPIDQRRTVKLRLSAAALALGKKLRYRRSPNNIVRFEVQAGLRDPNKV
jgi:hypothetical protein